MTVYTIAGRKGGIGKSTVAVHLAAELHRRGRAVMLIDADAQRSASTWARRALPQLLVATADDRDQLLEMATRARSDVVIDVAGTVSDLHLVGLFVADVAVLLTGPGMLDVEALAATAKLVANARTMRRSTAPRAIVVVNRCDLRTNLARDALDLIEQELFLRIVATIPASVAIGDAPGQGQLAAGAAGEVLRAACAAIIDHEHHNTHETTA